MEILDSEIIAKKSIRGIFALSSRTLVVNVLSFGASIVIFTVLKTHEVGIYVAVVAMQRVISFFSDFGLGAALVQNKKDIDQKDLSTVFTIQAVLTFVIFIIIFYLRDFFAEFFQINEAGVRLLLVLVFTIFLSSFKIIPSILLERNIIFHKQIVPQIVESLTFNALLIVLLLSNFGIDSFSVAFFCSSIIGIPIYYFINPWKIRLGIRKESLGHLRFGVAFQAKNILGTAKDDLLTVFLAKILTFTELSYIGFGQRFAFFAYRYVVDSVTKVTFSSFARLQHEKSLLKNAVEKTLFYVSSIMFPSLVGLIIVAPYIIAYFPKWNNKWEPAIISLIFFCLNALLSSVSGILVNIFDSTGRVKTTLKLMVLWTFLTWFITPLMIYFYGYNGVSVASFIVGTSIVITIHLAKKIINFELVKSIYKPVISTVFMGAIVFFLSNLLVFDLLSLFVVIILGVGVYLSLMYILARKELETGFKKIIDYEK